MGKKVVFGFILVVLTFFWVSFPGNLSAAGTSLAPEGIKFPDGSVQKTKATETGTPGPQGPKGDTGDTGATGPNGDTGDTGAPGSQGAQGDKGDTGAPGVQGDTGPQGLKGDTGDVGPAGPQGAAGFTSAICPVPKTGQTKCYDSGDPASEIPCTGTGQDGNLQRGFSWPNPRFTDNGNGTVTDNLTALIWLKNAECFGLRNWDNALNDCNTLASGQCGLSDSSLAGDWRLPNVKELQSLIDFAWKYPALSNDAGTAKWTSGDGSSFTGVTSDQAYWSSTTFSLPRNAWRVHLAEGYVTSDTKTWTRYVWPVRGGQ